MKKTVGFQEGFEPGNPVGRDLPSVFFMNPT